MPWRRSASPGTSAVRLRAASSEWPAPPRTPTSSRISAWKTPSLSVSALQGAYYIDRERVDHAIRTRRSFNAIHLSTVYKVDVFIAKATPFARQNMAPGEPEGTRPGPVSLVFVSGGHRPPQASLVRGRGRRLRSPVV